ncbi:MAG: helix-turn-helix domain-containing protein [Moorellaceae bacterium]
MEGFTAGEAEKLTGVPYDRLDYWARSGFIKPSVAGAKGKGSKRLYSFRDLVALKTAKELRHLGIPLQTLRKVVRYLRQFKGLENPLAEARLVVVGNDVLLVQSPEELISVLKSPGQGVLHLVFNLPKVVGELQEGIRKLRETA